jgi:hypothetical protein
MPELMMVNGIPREFPTSAVTTSRRIIGRKLRVYFKFLTGRYVAACIIEVA